MEEKQLITISADMNYNDSELESIAESLGDQFRVEVTRYERLSAENLLPYLLVAFGLITGGFFGAVGADVWTAFKNALGVAVEKKEQPTNMHFRYNLEKKDVELEVTTNDSKVIANAFDQMEKTMKMLVPDGTRYYFEFEKGDWVLRSVE